MLRLHSTRPPDSDRNVYMIGFVVQAGRCGVEMERQKKKLRLPE